MWQYLIIAQASQEGGWIVQLIPFVLIFGVFWFLVIRPQQKRHQKHQDYLNALKKGDKVVTAGGLFGTIEKVDDQIISLRISRDTKVKVLRQQIEGSQASFLTEEGEEEEEAEEANEESSDEKESKNW